MITKASRRLLPLALALAVALIVALPAVTLYILHRVDSNQRANTHALCALRADERQRVDSGRQFLLTHPGGIPGISPGLIRTSLSDEQRTVNALAGLTCPKPVLKPGRDSRTR